MRLLQRAKTLRKEATEAEAALWKALRNRKLGNFKFRRQHRLGFYIADFYCPQAKLIVEVDGEIHKGRTDYDELRTQELEAKGYKLIRFTNRQIVEAIDQVMENILVVCQQRTSPL